MRVIVLAVPKARQALQPLDTPGTSQVSNVGLQQPLGYSKKIVIFQEIQTGRN